MTGVWSLSLNTTSATPRKAQGRLHKTHFASSGLRVIPMFWNSWTQWNPNPVSTLWPNAFVHYQAFCRSIRTKVPKKRRTGFCGGCIVSRWATPKSYLDVYFLTTPKVAQTFLNDQCLSTHGKICPSSIFLTPSGEWKLGGFELLSNPKDEGALLYVRASLA